MRPSSERGEKDSFRHIRQAAGPASKPELPPDAPHVLLAVDQLEQTLGGGERVMMRLAALLPSYGFRVSILTFSLHPQSPVLHAPPCPIFVLPLRRSWDLRAMPAALELRRFLRVQRVRLVQTFFESADILVGIAARTIPGVRLVWSRRDMGILRAAKHHLAYRLLRRLPHHVFAVSEQVRQFCLETDRIPPGRCTTVYNGVDVARSSPDRLAVGPGRRPRVLAVGNIRRVKGHDILLEAAALVHRRFPDVEFAVAGEPAEAEYFASLRKRVAELGLGEHFCFLGGLSRLEAELNRADIFVMPSRSEGFSNAIIEAMAASLPVVATMVGGNPEAVADGVTGKLVPAENAAALAEAILGLLNDPARAREMGNAGRRRALARYTTGNMMDATVSIYHQLLSR